MAENDTKEEENVIPEDDILPEDIDISEEELDEKLQGKIKSLREKIAQCEGEKRKAVDDLQRARADFLNSKRRLEEQSLRDKERAADKIVLELLTLMDSFDTAMMDKDAWETLDQKWRTGIEAIQSKLNSILKAQGIEAIQAEGEHFDPNEHEAVGNAQVDDEAKVDTVLTVLQKGFKRNETVIRPARVIVGTK